MSTLAVSEDRVWGDRYLVVAALVLASLGLLSVFATTGIQRRCGASFAGSGLVIGMFACIVLTQIPAQTLLRFALPLAALALALFVLTLFTDPGVLKNGARRSMKLGPVFVMPAELAKPSDPPRRARAD